MDPVLFPIAATGLTLLVLGIFSCCCCKGCFCGTVQWIIWFFGIGVAVFFWTRIDKYGYMDPAARLGGQLAIKYGARIIDQANLVYAHGGNFKVLISPEAVTAAPPAAMIPLEADDDPLGKATPQDVIMIQSILKLDAWDDIHRHFEKYPTLPPWPDKHLSEQTQRLIRRIVKHNNWPRIDFYMTQYEPEELKARFIEDVDHETPGFLSRMLHNFNADSSSSLKK